MESLDRMLNNALREFDAGMQQAIYYSIFIDIVLLIALGIFTWCCCVYVVNYKRLVDESVRLKKTQKQHAIVKSERERLEVKRLKLELGFNEELNKLEINNASNSTPHHYR
ncbi:MULTISPECIES: hypothetical protein [Halomonadaceae]|jgi:predicted membrane protein|uniref:Uncharacterized protein n=2 Tax=Vreelandella TaxID=3137766 RepID=A0A7Z0S0A9_9GAMM|nr:MULTISPECIES: hypothetical protein [Halomonas]AJY52125.1 hypothetical protein KO116_03658 [Halomonas sp. KO116]NYS80236.1 hypothetical protein [Halomonas glaciei]|tara:strand:- start:976 stop:1308 length:333 start_codon:yes stop_codon:yes gene_type:complete